MHGRVSCCVISKDDWLHARRYLANFGRCLFAKQTSKRRDFAILLSLSENIILSCSSAATDDALVLATIFSSVYIGSISIRAMLMVRPLCSGLEG
jgi:hypothetical protein